jgi:hypothetical protein
MRPVVVTGRPRDDRGEVAKLAESGAGYLDYHACLEAL